MNSTGKKSPGLVNSLLGALRQFWKREDGVSVAIVGMSMVALMGSAALGMDVGRAYGVQRWLQSSADAAAVSGAGYINDGAANVTVNGSSVAHSIGVAYRYSVDSGEYNAKSGIVSSTVSGYPALVCLAGLNIPCVGSPSANALRVKLSATVPMYFGKVVGVNSMTVQAMATAQIGGSKAKPYNVMFIVDNTASMASTDANCSNVTKIKCAQNGVLALLKYLNTQNDSVGLMSYPELANPSKATKENTCPSTVMSVANGDIAPYANTSASEDGGTNPTGWVSDATYPTYMVVAPENTYLTAATTPTLNTTDMIVMAMGGGSCAGMTGPGGEGTFFADAITSAQYTLSQLKANGTATQKTAQMPRCRCSTTMPSVTTTAAEAAPPTNRSLWQTMTAAEAGA